MARAFTQAQKFGAEFSLSTEVKRVDCALGAARIRSGAHPRARRRPAGPGARGRGRHRRALSSSGDSEPRRGSRAAASRTGRRPSRPGCAATRTWPCVGGGNSAGQAAVFLASHARHVQLLVRRPGLSSTMSRYLDRSDRRLPEHHGALRHRDRGAPRHARPRSPGRAVAQPAHRGRGSSHAIAHLFLFTGADPAASCLSGCGVPLDEHGLRPDRRRRGLDRAGAVAAGDRRRGDLRRRRCPLRLRRSGSGRPSGRERRSSRSSTPSSPGGARPRWAWSPATRRCDQPAGRSPRAASGSRTST